MAPDDVGERLARLETEMRAVRDIVGDLRDTLRGGVLSAREWDAWRQEDYMVFRREMGRQLGDLRAAYQRLLITSLTLLGGFALDVLAHLVHL